MIYYMTRNSSHKFRQWL